MGQIPYKNKTRKTKTLTYRDVIDAIIKLSKDLEEATDLQKDEIQHVYIEKWLKGFANKSILWVGTLERIAKIETGNTEVIELELQSDELRLNLCVDIKWKKQLLKVSKNDTLVFNMTLPNASVAYTHIQTPSLDLRKDGQIVIVKLLGYKKPGERKMREFTSSAE